MSNYLRYFIVLLLFSSLFYSYTVEIKQSTIKKSLDKKLPIVIDKKGFILTLNTIELFGISNNIIESEINSTLQVSHANRFSKFLPKKSLNFTLHSKAIPKIKGTHLSFEVLSFKLNKFIHFKKVKGVLKRKIEAIKIHIKTLENFAWFASVKEVNFKNNGFLNIKLEISRWLIFLLLPLFLLREIGLVIIVFYQKFLSPRKKYKCAKGELYQNGTCSSVTKEAFKKHGFIAGIKAYRASTKECKEAYKILKKDRPKYRLRDACFDIGCNGCSSVPSNVGSSSSACDFISCDVLSC